MNDVAFPLTPARSLGERENGRQSVGVADSVESSRIIHRLFPLLVRLRLWLRRDRVEAQRRRRGEGQGEGEAISCIQRR